MSTEVEKIKQIYSKVSLLVSTIQKKTSEIEELKQENKSIVDSKLKLEIENSTLKQEIEKLKTVDNSNSTIENKVGNEGKINGMIKEIEECLALLSS